MQFFNDPEVKIGCGREHFFAIDQNGKIYDVHEFEQTDNRRKSKLRLARNDNDTGNCLLNISLYPLPEGFSSDDPIKFILLQLAFLRTQNDDLKTEVMDLRRSMMSEIETVAYDVDDLKQWRNN